MHVTQTVIRMAHKNKLYSATQHFLKFWPRTLFLTMKIYTQIFTIHYYTAVRRQNTLFRKIFKNAFFCITNISLSFSILGQKILAGNCLQNTIFEQIKTLYPIFCVGFSNQNTLSNVRVYNTSNLAGHSILLDIDKESNNT